MNNSNEVEDDLAGVPFVAFGNDELSALPRARAGESFACARCGQRHELEAANDSDGNPSDLLLFYNCGEKVYLGAVSGALVVSVFPNGPTP